MKKARGRMLVVRGTAVVLVMSLATMGPISASAEPPAGPGQQDADERRLLLYLGQSKLIDAPWLVARVSVTDPKIADVQVLSPKDVLVQGKSVGTTDLILWSKEEQVWQAQVEVKVDLRGLESDLRQLFPKSTITLAQARDVVVVRGLLRRAEEAVQLTEFMDATGLTYVDMTSVAGVQQVLLRVRVAEVDRKALRLLGINAFMTGSDAFGGSMVGRDGSGAINPVSIGLPSGTLATTGTIETFQFTSAVNVSSSVTLFGGFPDAALEIFLQALAENQYLRILAEPNIVALSGQEASFLVGGEFPVPIIQGSTVGGGSSITVEYKEYGVRLRFRPTVLGDGHIRLYVAPEVSQLSDLGAVQIEGFTIPSVLTRRVETTLELNSGQTFAMAGLISRTINARSSRVPGLGDLPVIGALFRSVRYTNEETDLVIMVTASLVEPMSLGEDPPLPGALYVEPSDWELYGLGRIEGQAPAKLSPAQIAWLKKWKLDQLRGPGAWATYRQSAPTVAAATDSADSESADETVQDENETEAGDEL